MRSNLAVPDGTAVMRALRPGASAKAVSGTDCQASMVWKRGWRASERVGLSASTRWSKGSASCSWAPRVVVRTRSSRSRNVGSPDVSVRSTTVLVKNPTRSAVASSARPATGVPRGMSVPQPCRVSRAASPACTVMNTLAPVVRASRVRAVCAASSRWKGTVSPRCEATAGRGRSAGSSSWSGSPARACFQYARCRSARAVGAWAGPRRRCWWAAWSAYCSGSGSNRGASPASRAA
ncbi:hypothetical protein SMD44_08613 [Streptomyces alboflavus]|uniref:Uncharacterized protein n=1 Tax=Streptomyces alboflavus TaxID=67267 RepID=A0A1Z1WRS2_9ACTN|nr:hypothetical protein SMD44_08613 [Streptomyces alboflavus]